MKRRRRVLFLMSVTLLMAIGDIEFDSHGDDSVSLAYAEDQDRDSTYIAPFVPTPQEVVDRMLELAQVSHRDLLYDLGSGDGRIVITAARRYGAQAVGFEIDPALVTDSKRNIKEAGLEALAEIRDQERPHGGSIACQCRDDVSVSRSQPAPERCDHAPVEAGLQGGFSRFQHGGLEARSGGADDRLGRLRANDLSLAHWRFERALR